MTELRKYQRELLQRVQETLISEHGPVMMQLPTGGGKTFIAAHLLADHLIGGCKAVWLTHREELADQTCDMLRRAVRVSVARPNWTRGKAAPPIRDGVAIFMAQTASPRSDQSGIWNRYDDNDLMIIDEAHHAVAKGWERAIRQWPGRVLGMTATPWRLSRKEGFDHLFSKLICGPQVADLQSQEFL